MSTSPGFTSAGVSRHIDAPFRFGSLGAEGGDASVACADVGFTSGAGLAEDCPEPVEDALFEQGAGHRLAVAVGPLGGGEPRQGLGAG
jgi:hypothetical protein